MTTGDGIVTAMMMYLAFQLFLVWLTTEKPLRRPAAIEAKLDRLEKILREDCGVEI